VIGYQRPSSTWKIDATYFIKDMFYSTQDRNMILSVDHVCNNNRRTIKEIIRRIFRDHTNIMTNNNI
jgi:hypothetical protein